MAITALQRAQQLAQQVAEVEHDMNVATKGGGGSKLLPAGTAMARFIGYIEVGQHIQVIKGKPKDTPDNMVRLGFALWGTAPNGEKYNNDDGTPTVRWYPFEINLSANEKAKSYKLFKKMNYKGTAKQFIGLLGEPFLLPIKQEPMKTDPAKLVNVYDIENLAPPYFTDPVTGQMNQYPVPEAPDDVYSYFLWNNPDQADLLETFHSLFVDGKWDDGSSKNRIQERILSAVNFNGSPLQLGLTTSGANIEFPPLAAAPSTVPATVPQAPIPQAVPQVPAVLTAPAIPAAPSIPAIPSMPVIPA